MIKNLAGHGWKPHVWGPCLSFTTFAVDNNKPFVEMEQTDQCKRLCFFRALTQVSIETPELFPFTFGSTGLWSHLPHSITAQLNGEEQNSVLTQFNSLWTLLLD